MFFCPYVFFNRENREFFVLMFLCLFLQSPGSLLGGSAGTVGLAFGFEQLRLGLFGADILFVVQAVEQRMQFLAVLDTDVTHAGSPQAIEVRPAAQCLSDVAS